MENIEKIIRDCKVGIKAFQNINAAALGFLKMIGLANTQDPILMPSVFYWSVIRYAKPFLNSKFEGGKICYPIKNIKNTEGFSEEIHDHIITVRNALVAHDDFTEITPRILKFGMTLADEDFFIPTSIVVSNKCISFPCSPETVQKMQVHAQACCNVIHIKLIKDIEEIRSITLSNPEVAKEGQKYSKNYGQAKTEKEGTHMQPPEFMNDEWLNASVPDYSDLHNGYMYEDARVKKDFHGPEKITTPSGQVLEISPKIPE